MLCLFSILVLNMKLVIFGAEKNVDQGSLCFMSSII